MHDRCTPAGGETDNAHFKELICSTEGAVVVKQQAPPARSVCLSLVSFFVSFLVQSCSFHVRPTVHEPRKEAPKESDGPWVRRCPGIKPDQARNKQNQRDDFAVSPWSFDPD